MLSERKKTSSLWMTNPPHPAPIPSLMSSKRLSLSLFPLSIAAALTLGSSADALLFDDFSTGYTQGASAVGQGGGTGWAPGALWGSNANGGETSSGTILNQALVIQKTGTTTSGNVMYSRRYDGAGLTVPYTLTLTYTLDNIDSLLAGGFAGVNDTNAADYVQLFERNASGAQNDFAAEGSWLIRGGRLNAAGASITRGTSTNSAKTNYNADAPLNWYVFDYVPLVASDFNSANVVDTGIALAAGTTYTFGITINGNGTYKVSISDGVTTFAPDASFGFRSADTGIEANFNHNLHFGYKDAGHIADTKEGVSLKVDNIQIVPEPSAFALSALSLAGFAAMRRRRR